MFDVILAPEAQEFFAAADAPFAKKLARCFLQLEQDPRRHPNIKKLSGEFDGYRRYRVGDWRVIFSVDDGQQRVFVLAVGHRRDVYE